MSPISLEERKQKQKLQHTIGAMSKRITLFETYVRLIDCELLYRVIAVSEIWQRVFVSPEMKLQNYILINGRTFFFMDDDVFESEEDVSKENQIRSKLYLRYEMIRKYRILVVTLIECGNMFPPICENLANKLSSFGYRKISRMATELSQFKL